MPGGRPTKIDQVLDTRGGQPVTVADTIVSAVRAGNYIETAAALAGITKPTLYDWLNTGSNAAMKGGKLTAQERRCMEFSNAVGRAMAESEAEDVAGLAALARGVTRVERIVVDAEGNELSRTTVAERTPPNDKVLMWRLERRFGERWGRNRIEVSGPEGGPMEVSIDEVQGHQLAEVLRGVVFELVEEVRRDLEAGSFNEERLAEIEAGVPALLRQQIERVVGE